MTKITLTRFNVGPRSYSKQDSYVACWKSNPDQNCPSIDGYLNGLIKQMQKFTDEPAAWSFSEWKGKGSNNTLDNWMAATAVVLEYRGKDLSQVAADLHTRANELGYAHIIMDSLSRKGEQTIAIIFPITESINKDQYARLASVLSEELGQYRAAEGNMAVSHLVHVDARCSVAAIDGAVIAPKAKIKETAKLYQSMDPRRFEASSAKAGAQIAEPVFTNDGLFEFPATPAESADALLRSIGVVLQS